MQTLIDFFGSADFIPHGYCLSWSPLLLWLHVVSDAVITLSYYSIPLSLAYFTSKRQFPYRWLINLFALFIVACGTTHLISLINIWLPIYWLDGYVKAFTAVISLATAILMLRVIPLALQLPTATQLQAEIAERQQTQKALEIANIRFTALFNSMHNGVAVYEAVEDAANFVFLDFNRAGEVLDGIKREDLLGKPVTQVFPGVEQFGLLAVMRRVWQTGQAEHLPISLYDDGRLTVYRENYVYRLPSGELVAVYEDVTQQKLAQLAEKKAAERLEKIASRVPGVMYQFRLNPDGSSCFPYASPAIQNIYRVSPQEVQENADKVFAILHPDDYQKIVDSIALSAKQLSPWQLEYRVRFSDGVVRWLFGNAMPQREDDGSTLWHGFITDITERKQIEQIKQQQYTLLLNVINSLSHPFYVVNIDDYTVQLANKSAGEWLKNKTTCYQLSHQQNMPCGLLDGYPCPIQEVKQTKQAVVLQHIHKDKSGVARTVEIFAYPIFNEQGEVHQLIEYVIDVTERVKNELALKQYSRDLNERVNELRCLYAISELVKNDALNQEQMIGRCLDLLVEAYKYPEITAFRISLFNRHYQTANFRSAPWQQEALIKVQDKVVGRIEICFLQKRRDDAQGVFLAERELLDTVARVLGETFERKQIQREILNTKNQLQATLDAIPDLLFEVDIEGRYYDYHAPRSELLAAAPEIFLGKTLDEILPVEAAAVCFSALEEAQRLGYSTGKEIQLKLEHGDYWFELSVACKLTDQQTSRFIMLSRDVTERKQTEMALNNSQQRLRESKNFFELLAQINPVGIYQTDAQGQCVFVNPKWCEIAGIDAQQALGEGWREAIMREDRDIIYQEWNRSVREQRLFRLEYRFQKADGAITWVYGLSSVIHDEHGQVSGYIGTIIDISERKAMEDILKAQQAFTVSILDSLTSHIAVLNAAGEIVMVNRAWQQFGEKNGLNNSCLGDNYLTVCRNSIQLEEDTAIIFQGISDVLAGIKPNYHTEYPCNTRTEPLWFYMTVSPLRGNKAGVVISHENITQRVLMEQELRNSEAKLRTIIEVSRVPMALNDEQANITYLNPAFIQTFGYDLNDIPTLADWWPKAYPDTEYRQWVATNWQKNLEKAKRENIDFPALELAIRCKNNTIKTVLVTAAVMSTDFTGEHLVQLYDITERKQAEAELKRSNAELDQFAYAVSHDMRQPLRMVSSYLSLIETALKNKLDEETGQFLHFALDGAKRMDAMILSLLDYSRVGRHTKLLAWVSSRAALDEALAFLNPELQACGGTINVSGDWRELYASQDELSRLLQNLIGNALKYHEKNSPPRVDIEAITVNNLFRVNVRDFGIGIDANQINRLFKVFSRLQARSNFEGTGVGLALCRKIVEHHGGTIGVESAGEGQGSVFWFELPLITASKNDALNTRH